MFDFICSPTYNKYLPHTFHSTAKLRFGLSSFTETLCAHREREDIGT